MTESLNRTRDHRKPRISRTCEIRNLGGREDYGRREQRLKLSEIPVYGKKEAGTSISANMPRQPFLFFSMLVSLSVEWYIKNRLLSLVLYWLLHHKGLGPLSSTLHFPLDPSQRFSL